MLAASNLWCSSCIHWTLAMMMSPLYYSQWVFYLLPPTLDFYNEEYCSKCLLMKAVTHLLSKSVFCWFLYFYEGASYLSKIICLVDYLQQLFGSIYLFWGFHSRMVITSYLVSAVPIDTPRSVWLFLIHHLYHLIFQRLILNFWVKLFVFGKYRMLCLETLSTKSFLKLNLIQS